MQLLNSYMYFKSALTDQQCDEIIKAGESEMDLILKHGGSTSAETLYGKTSSQRDTDVSWLNQTKIYELLHPFMHEANSVSGWNFEWDHSESMQYTKYGNKQFYGWHADSDVKPYPLDFHPNIAGKIRKLSMTVNLSNEAEYKGGNLKFDFGPHYAGKRHQTCKEIRPRGSIVVFPSHIYHQITPITSGTRRSLVMWSVGPPFR
mgnify:CR=1 FL=1|jgi:PKHD-type hydroxylase